MAQPSAVAAAALCEVLRVVKPGGKIVIVDYALPRWWHPLRYLWRPLLAKLEPFALDLWREEIADWLPQHSTVRWRKQVFFGGLYQKLVLTRQEYRTTARCRQNQHCGNVPNRRFSDESIRSELADLMEVSNGARSNGPVQSHSRS
jgi:SAM-dependent methyltransferase